MLVSPIAGALLDRHGRVRLVILGSLMGGAAWITIGALALAGALPAWLLVTGCAVTSLTGPLANGLRSLFPVLVPRALWERVNAVDSNGYVLATLVGPPFAGVLVSVIGGPATILLIGVVALASGLVLIGMPDPVTTVATTGRLLTDAWRGLAYVARHPTLRGLAFTLSFVNLGGGMTAIVIPIVIQDRYGAGPDRGRPRVGAVGRRRRDRGVRVRTDQHPWPRTSDARVVGAAVGRGARAAPAAVRVWRSCSSRWRCSG